MLYWSKCGTDYVVSHINFSSFAHFGHHDRFAWHHRWVRIQVFGSYAWLMSKLEIPLSKDFEQSITIGILCRL